QSKVKTVGSPKGVELAVLYHSSEAPARCWHPSDPAPGVAGRIISLHRVKDFVKGTDTTKGVDFAVGAGRRRQKKAPGRQRSGRRPDLGRRVINLYLRQERASEIPRTADGVEVPVLIRRGGQPKALEEHVRQGFPRSGG